MQSFRFSTQHSALQETSIVFLCGAIANFFISFNQPSPFFTEQLMAFEVWLDHGSEDKKPPEQLPIVLQVRHFAVTLTYKSFFLVVVVKPSLTLYPRYPSLCCYSFNLVEFLYSYSLQKGSHFGLCAASLSKIRCYLLWCTSRFDI